MDVALEQKICGYKQIALEKLENIILTIPRMGGMDLCIESDMIKILDSFASATWLKSKGFDRIFRLASSPPPKNKNLVFIIFANILTFKKVLDHISFLLTKTTDDDSLKEFHIILVPNLYHSFASLLESQGLVGHVNLYRFAWDFIKIDQNLLSLEIPSVFADVFVRKDKSILSSIANSLRIFNMIHKRPKIVLTYGENSESIVKMVSRMEGAKKSSDEPSDFDAMLVMDRDADYASTLLTPVTYSALLVEVFNVKAGILNLEGDNKIEEGKLAIFRDDSKSESAGDAKNLRMCGSSDQLYTANKFRHFSDVLKTIKAESRSVEEENRKFSRDMSVEQMKEFVEQNLPKVAAQKRNLFKHLIACEKIVNELSSAFERRQNIEEMMTRGENRKQVLAFLDESLATAPHKYNVLRLAALFHTLNGFAVDEAQKFVANYLNAFGSQHLHVFHNLFKAKLFPDFLGPAKKLDIINIKKTPFMIDAAKLKLIPETKKQVCPSFVFSGNFIPLVAHLASSLIEAKNLEELKNKIASLLSLKMSIDDDLRKLKDISTNFSMQNRKIFIFICGGITYAEVAACNIIECLTGATIVLASDEITCGANLMKAAMMS